MKLRLLAMVIVLGLVAWAQESPNTSTPNASQAPAKSCCHHAMDAKDAEGCCHHASADAKDAMDCCGKDKCEKKDAKSCCSGKDKDMKACMKACKKHGGCADGKCCGPTGDKSAVNCCGNKCEHHDHMSSGT
jgi:hypothetical protein